MDLESEPDFFAGVGVESDFFAGVGVGLFCRPVYSTYIIFSLPNHPISVFFSFPHFAAFCVISQSFFNYGTLICAIYLNWWLLNYCMIT